MIGPYELNKCYNEDSLESLKKIPDNSIDLICTDPPYNIDYSSNSGSKEYRENLHAGNTWDKDFNFSPFFNELMRVLKQDGIMYIFSRFDTYADYMKNGLPVPYSVLIWDKLDYHQGNLKWWSCSYEIVLCYTKGKRELKIGNMKRPDGLLRFFKVQNTTNQKGNSSPMEHPTEKPVSLIMQLIKYSSNEEDIVLDTFGGGGSLAVSCIKLNRNFLIFEKEKKYCEIIERKISEQWKQIKSF